MGVLKGEDECDGPVPCWPHCGMGDSNVSEMTAKYSRIVKSISPKANATKHVETYVQSGAQSAEWIVQRAKGKVQSAESACMAPELLSLTNDFSSSAVACTYFPRENR